LQLSGDVSDDSAQAIGRQLGDQAIVTGSLTNLGNVYRFRVKVINVETARIEAQFSYNLGNNQQVAFLLSESQNTPPVSSASPSVPAGSSGSVAVAQTNKAYKIGDTGPAGGFIFYDKGSYSDGWRYLEAASTDALAQWRHNSGALSETAAVVGETPKAIGAGQINTQNIMRYFSQNGGGFGLAAQVCDELEVNGFDDWFLPSQDELSYIYGNLYRKGLGGFKKEWYYSSTIVKGNYTGGSFAPSRINFENGEPGDGESGVSRRVRAIRQF
jgi:hypothetical protein